jgi:hypothetical protein
MPELWGRQAACRPANISQTLHISSSTTGLNCGAPVAACKRCQPCVAWVMGHCVGGAAASMHSCTMDLAVFLWTVPHSGYPVLPGSGCVSMDSPHSGYAAHRDPGWFLGPRTQWLPCAPWSWLCIFGPCTQWLLCAFWSWPYQYFIHTVSAPFTVALALPHFYGHTVATQLQCTGCQQRLATSLVSMAGNA